MRILLPKVGVGSLVPAEFGIAPSIDSVLKMITLLQFGESLEMYVSLHKVHSL
jgi:hypothetical protein